MNLSKVLFQRKERYIPTHNKDLFEFPKYIDIITFVYGISKTNNVENNKLILAREYVNKTSRNIFLTGKAGTGKTTFLKELVSYSPKRKIVLAPTGIAAINAGGTTLHSFFQLPFGLCLPDYNHIQNFNKGGNFKFNKNKLQIIRSLELIIIDEVSMVRADIIDEVDAILRRIRNNTKPFGGVQVLMIGDIQQLPPVVKDQEWEIMRKYYDSPFFFDSKVLKNSHYVSIELDHIYRQKDKEFIEILAAVRENNLDNTILQKLNSHYNPNFTDDNYIVLTTHNKTSNSINQSKLDVLTTPNHNFYSKIVGNFPEYLYPQEAVLTLKKGARVMFTKNDAEAEKRFVNGTIGTVIKINSDQIDVELSDGKIIEVKEVFWENLKYSIDDKSKEIVSEIDGLFYHYPLRLAWAITIHKSQGLTFDNAVIDAGSSFSHGQVYVALSRCRTLDGLILKTKISSKSVINEKLISDFSEKVSKNCPDENMLNLDSQEYYLNLLQELFNLSNLKNNYLKLINFFELGAKKLYPIASSKFNCAQEKLDVEIFNISSNFQRSLKKIISNNFLTDEYLQDRVTKASMYFLSKCQEEVLPLINLVSNLEFDSKDDKKAYRHLHKQLFDEYLLKVQLWEHTRLGFNMDNYLKEKVIITLNLSNQGVSKVKKIESNTSDILNKPLFDELKVWRQKLSKELEIPVYCVCHQKTLIAISNKKPQNVEELISIKGVGKVFIKKYGLQILDIIKNLK